MMPQAKMILDYLIENDSITQRDAINLGCYRLASRISDIRKAGIPVIATREKVEKTDGSTTYIARYALLKGGAADAAGSVNSKAGVEA